MTPSTRLSQECIYEKKVMQPCSLHCPHGRRAVATQSLERSHWSISQVAEIKQKQEITMLNAQYKVDKLERIEQRKAEVAAKKAQKAAEVKAAQAKYASKR